MSAKGLNKNTHISGPEDASYGAPAKARRQRGSPNQLLGSSRQRRTTISKKDPML